MRTLKHFCATLTLLLALSGVALAGQSDAPPRTDPIQPSPIVIADSTQSTSEDSATDPCVEFALSFFQTFLSIF